MTDNFAPPPPEPSRLPAAPSRSESSIESSAPNLAGSDAAGHATGAVAPTAERAEGVTVRALPRLFNPETKLAARLRTILRFCIDTMINPWIGPAVENAPDWSKLGPVIIAPNHASFADPILVQSAIPRDIRFMMTEGIYRVKWMRWFFDIWGAIPVPDGSALKVDAIKSALAAMRSGKTIGIFPEGGIARDGVLQVGQPGVVMLMVKARLPVIPVAVIGSYKLLPFHARFPRAAWIRVRFGTPIMPPERVDKDGALEFAAKIMAEIARLSNEN